MSKHTAGQTQLPCDVQSCRAYNTEYEMNCEINCFTFVISKCLSYKPESATGENIEDLTSGHIIQGGRHETI